MENERLVVQNAKSTQTHELKRSVTPHDSDGVWFHENKGELIITDDGKRTWVIHIPISQEATIRKAKWKQDTLIQTKLDGRCTLDYGYEPELPDQMWMICTNYEHDWVRIHSTNPFITADWSGIWTSDVGWKLHVEMSGQNFDKVYMESADRIIDFEASWVGGSQGKSILMERRKDPDAVAAVSPLIQTHWSSELMGQKCSFIAEVYRLLKLRTMVTIGTIDLPNLFINRDNCVYLSPRSGCCSRSLANKEDWLLSPACRYVILCRTTVYLEKGLAR